MRVSLAVVGDPVEHSLSPVIHRAALDASGLPGWGYERVRVRPGELAQRWPELRRRYLGINVTAPHKLAATRLVDRLSPSARRCGSVNTVSFGAGGSVGDSTDGRGFCAPLARLLPRSAAVVLGAGGAARAVGAALAGLGVEVVLAARSIDAARAAAAEVGSGCRAISLTADPLSSNLEVADLLVNATPVGGPGHPGQSPLPPGVRLRAGTVVYDLLYLPAVTPLQEAARASGCTAIGGLEMLVEQAALAFEMFTGRPAPRREMAAAAVRALAEVTA